VPSGALDECGKSHHAAHDCGDDTGTGLFALKSLMALVCHHDVPLLFCDITMPSKARFYPIALLQKLASLLPHHASIGGLYDISCQLEHSIAKHDLIPDIAQRLSLAMSVFHVYAHQFCCQVVFHPHKHQGFGMSNGKGNEHIWALSKDTIGNEHISGIH
ncbi:hypothetical protein K439DRAFT_1376245, partial [Ramaria rubella]